MNATTDGKILSRIKVNCDQLKLGMYVAELDRPWLDTPFLFQGFELSAVDEIQQLQQYCDFVYIDKEISNPKVSAALAVLERSSGRIVPKAVKRGRPAIRAERPPRRVHYQDKSSWQEELPKAHDAIKDVSNVFGSIISDRSKTDQLDVPRIRKAVTPMVDSIIRNPDACIWLARLKSGSDYEYKHALGSSIWCVVLGRQLGLSRKELNKLALGGLVFDIGKIKIDQELLSQPRKLTEDELKIVRGHVEAGIQELRSQGDVDPDILSMVAFHHERHDGSGYPRGLREGEIPVYARIAAIADCYDALTNRRPYASPISPAEAISKIYEFRDVDFQAELVDEFIQAIGIYPAGSVVMLSTGEVAVVVAESRTARLHPKVMMMLDADGKPVNTNKPINLTEYKDADGRQVNILRSLEPDAVGIDVTTVGV